VCVCVGGCVCVCVCVCVGVWVCVWVCVWVWIDVLRSYILHTAGRCGVLDREMIESVRSSSTNKITYKQLKSVFVPLIHFMHPINARTRKHVKYKSITNQITGVESF
jgi:hypothetical protein